MCSVRHNKAFIAERARRYAPTWNVISGGSSVFSTRSHSPSGFSQRAAFALYLELRKT